MEELNKNQIVLLTLLVSFVTSIATGIVTVTLMDQAPRGMTQTINRVVERTIEKVIPGQVTEKIVVKEVPVLITEEQIISDLVQSESSGVVLLATEDGRTILGSAAIISNDGLVVTANNLLGTDVASGKKFTLILGKGNKVDALVSKFSVDSDIALLQADKQKLTELAKADDQVGTATSTTSTRKSWISLEIAETESFPGQTVVALGASSGGSINVAGGIVSSLITSATSSDVIFIKTNAVNQGNIGGPVFNTKGKIIGLSVAPGSAVFSKAIKDLINQ